MPRFHLASIVFLVSVSLVLAAGDFYSLTAIDIEGKEVPMETYRGKVSIIILILKHCMHT